MSLIDDILSRENLNRAFKRVKANKGCAGIDNMPVIPGELLQYKSCRTFDVRQL